MFVEENYYENHPGKATCLSDVINTLLFYFYFLISNSSKNKRLFMHVNM